MTKTTFKTLFRLQVGRLAVAVDTVTGIKKTTRLVFFKQANPATSSPSRTFLVVGKTKHVDGKPQRKLFLVPPVGKTMSITYKYGGQ